jgi:acyl-CoA synthetase (AMP-forming)/AMP-acid ligase II
VSLRNLAEVLEGRAARTPDCPSVQFMEFVEDGERLASRTYAELDRRARAIASRLLDRLKPGDRAVLIHEPGLDFVEAFFGCLYAGVIAVPLAPARSTRTRTRVTGVVRDCEAGLILLSEKQERQAGARLGVDFPALATDTVPDEEASHFRNGASSRDSIAFLQYTSGSTGDLKGVEISQRALLHNLAQIREAMRLDVASVGVGWLPHYHDMGLIGTILQPVYTGFRVTLMSPQAFVQRPERWLRAISRFGGNTCGSPNFGYQLCVDRIPDSALAELDLRSWGLAWCGAEPIQATTLESFARRFAVCGFRATSFYPCYGLAEATLFVTGSVRGAGPMVKHLSATALELGKIRRAEEEGPDARAVVGCGFPRRGTSLELVDACQKRAAPGQVGEIWVRGSNLGSGYWRQPDASREQFGARLAGESAYKFLRTGDLGFWADGQLFISGRVKDLIIVEGRNIAPQDLEWTAEHSHAEARRVAAFGVGVEGTEQPALMVEVKTPKTLAELEEVGDDVRRKVSSSHDLALHAVLLVRLGSLPTTTSGKLIRSECRRAYVNRTAAPLLAWHPSTGWTKDCSFSSSLPALHSLVSLDEEVVPKDVS